MGFLNVLKGNQSKWNDIGSQFIFFLNKLNKQLTVNVVSAKGQPVWEKTAELRFSWLKIWIWACLLFVSAYFNKHQSLRWAIVFCVPRTLAFLEDVGGKGFKRWAPPKLSRLWIDESAIVCFYEFQSSPLGTFTVWEGTLKLLLLARWCRVVIWLPLKCLRIIRLPNF